LLLGIEAVNLSQSISQTIHMKNIIAFAGSNSSTSINHKLVVFAASQIKNHHENYQVKVIKLTDFNLPMFSEDLEKEQGFSPNLRLLHQEIANADGVIIAVNEYNSGVSGFFKNTTDWLSRIDRDFLKSKKVLLLSTSPGGRGAMTALEFTKNVFPRFGAEITDSFSFPKFYENFSTEENKILDEALSLSFNDVLQNFIRQLES